MCDSKGNVVASRIRLKVEWRLGTASIDWDEIAKKEHLDEIDAYMQRFTRTIKAVNDELKEIRLKEQQMREITGLPSALPSTSPLMACL